MAKWRPGTDRRQTSHQRGLDAEQHAAAYLQDQGLELITRNYHAPCGEIDIIMRDGAILVFVEVRHRAREHFCRATETIDAGKQQRLRATAEHYMQQHAVTADADCRFDVITLTGPMHNINYHWLTNAL